VLSVLWSILWRVALIFNGVNKMVKTNIVIVLGKNEPIELLMAMTIKALRGAGLKREAEYFQQDACSGNKPFIEVVEDYVILEME